MKYVCVILLLGFHVFVFGQSKTDVIGKWKLKTVADESGKRCAKIEKYTLSIYPDQTYDMHFGGTSYVEGKWMWEAGKIKFDARSIWDPCYEWRVDKEFKSVEIPDSNSLVIHMFICGKSTCKSLFKRKRTK